MLLLKCYQRLGYFPRLDTIPTVLVDQLRASLGIADRVAPVYAVDRTGKRHRAWVRRRLGGVWEPARVRAVAEAAMRSQVNGGFYRLVASRLTDTDRARLPGLLIVDPISRHSLLPRLTEAAPKATVTRLKAHIEWVRPSG